MAKVDGNLSENALSYSSIDCLNSCSYLCCQALPPPGGDEGSLQVRLQRAIPPAPPPGVMRARCRRACNGPFHLPDSREPVAFLSFSLSL